MPHLSVIDFGHGNRMSGSSPAARRSSMIDMYSLDGTISKVMSRSNRSSICSTHRLSGGGMRSRE